MDIFDQFDRVCGRFDQVGLEADLEQATASTVMVVEPDGVGVLK